MFLVVFELVEDVVLFVNWVFLVLIFMSCSCKEAYGAWINWVDFVVYLEKL